MLGAVVSIDTTSPIPGPVAHPYCGDGGTCTHPGCGAERFAGMHPARGPDICTVHAVDLNGSGGCAVCGHELHSDCHVEEDGSDIWPDPIRFMSAPPGAGLPEAMRGTLLGDQAEMLHGEWGVPQLLSASTGLGCAAAATRGRYRVAIASGATFPTALYLAPVAVPGSMKSPVLAWFGGPLEVLQSQAVRDHGPELFRLRQESEAVRSAIKTRTADLARAIGSGNEDAADSARAELQALGAREQSLDEQRADGVQCIVFGADMTYEALVNKAADNGGRVAVLSAEAGLIENLAGRYSDGAARTEFLNSAYDLEPYTRERVGDAPRTIAESWATLLMVVQPDVIGTMLDSRHMRNRGFMQRFWFADVPSTPYRARHDLPDLPRDARDLWRHRLEGIWNRPGDPITIDQSGARAALREFELETIAPAFKAADEAGDYLMRGWLAKAGMTAVRVAAVMQLLEDPAASAISGRIGQAAAGYGRLMVDHARHLFTGSRQAVEASPRGKVLAWLALDPQNPYNPHNPTEAGGYRGYRGFRGGVRTTDAWQRFRDQEWCKQTESVREVMRDLASLGWLSGPVKSTGEKGGRPTETWRLHPRLRENYQAMTATRTGSGS